MSRTNIQSDRESIYFILSVIFSVLIYVLAAVSIIGIGIALTVFAFLLFANAVMLGSIRGNGVRIHERQFPDVYERVQTLSAQMELDKVPDVFVIQSEGALNAFATRFFGRDMVVLYSEVFELAREQGQDELDFIIAHELAHVKRRHVWKNLLILPAGFIPFLSTAYSRSCEYTCDRQAAYEIQNAAAAKRALTLLGIGKKAYVEVNEDAYREQITTESNAFVWLAEVLSTHPRLPKRIQSIDWFSRADVKYYQPKHGQIALGATVLAIVMSLAYAGVISIFATTAAFADQFLLGFEDGFYEEMYTVEGETPLMAAAAGGDVAGVEQALTDGEDIHAKDSEGSDALMYAVHWGDPEVIQTLLDAGADANTSDYYTTALAITVMYEDYESAKLLIENGADPAFKGPDGLSAIDEMGMDSEEEFMEMLEQGY
ncbi:M48 family metalloprotease [Planococcus sp. CP5-4]|uniref:M48 family metallopeptidase n=1 Tax=unclassified Planococcus (in: firmicutes) TaxID=2662419 RepID=UPI001C21E8C4|nr:MULTISPECIES: M48 family metallopeptidase [unclassified Planococcus (in: firmicutes)]MBU9674006.1 M48 family metalloprotease [Planococcus sp. CP5-4_YE]MBV0909877.1 M48 family metalloprotease [Planococcus sp. CP5-4_UN]MBW6064757.1 M48 family metalloprotease [Planococcus sp. CP5-4]